MVKYPPSSLSRTFAALVDPTRRAILTRLDQEPGLSIGELAEPFAIRLPGIMKHLDVLADAGLIVRTKTGRTVSVHLVPEPLAEASVWLKRYEPYWSTSLDQLAEFVEDATCRTGRL